MIFCVYLYWNNDFSTLFTSFALLHFVCSFFCFLFWFEYKPHRFRCHTWWTIVPIDSEGIAQRIVANSLRPLASWSRAISSVSLHANHLVDSAMMRWHHRRIWNRAPHQPDWRWSCCTYHGMLSLSRRCHEYAAAKCT